MDGEYLTEVPTNLKKLIQMVVRGFYTIEDVVIVDLLVKNLCLSEDTICDLLKFDRKMLRQRINTMKADRLLQTKNKMITLEDGKSQREQYYFINYKSFVNVIKYKLDHIRKKLEMEERNQTSRASFVCPHCERTYTDLEADQLLDLSTQQLVCIICRTEVLEDETAIPRSDTRVMLTRFNEQLEPLFTLLREVENIKLSAEFSDPNPQEVSDGKKVGPVKTVKTDSSRVWSGEASRSQGFQVEKSIDVAIHSEEQSVEQHKPREEPAWLSQTSSFITTQITDSNQAVDSKTSAGSTSATPHSTTDARAPAAADSVNSDVMSLLQAHEPKTKRALNQNSDSDDSIEEIPKKSMKMPPITYNEESLDAIMEGEDSDEGDATTFVTVGGERIPIASVDNTVIARMTQQEKNLYINAYQELVATMGDW